MNDGGEAPTSSYGTSVDDVAPRQVLTRQARRAYEAAEALTWKSYDPYDILLSPATHRLVARSPLAARIALQLGRRSGSRLRRLLRVPLHEEPQALAHFVQAAVMLASSGEEWAAAYAHDLSRRLATFGGSPPEGQGWGVQFPWVSRFGSMAAGEPNIYTTTVVCQALLDDYELEKNAPVLEAALRGVRFIVRGLGSFSYRGRAWFRYAAGSTNPIVNVQASSASLLARAASLSGEQRFLEAADSAAETAVLSQRLDGSWTYSDDERGAFVDGFHTGFTLQGLQEYSRRRGKRAVAGTARAIEAGFTYFKTHLLTPDGLPRGFADGRVSLDGQNLAQAVQTLLVCGGDADARSAARILQLGVERGHLDVDERGLPGLRWSVGPMLVATASLVQATGASRSPDTAGSAGE